MVTNSNWYVPVAAKVMVPVLLLVAEYPCIPATSSSSVGALRVKVWLTLEITMDNRKYPAVEAVAKLLKLIETLPAVTKA